MPRTSFENTYRIATTKEKQTELKAKKTRSRGGQAPGACKITCRVPGVRAAHGLPAGR